MALHSADRAAYLSSRVPRKGFQKLAETFRAMWIPSSHNKKLGPIPACIVTPSTCPPSCGHFGQGCFGEFGPIAAHWKRAGEAGLLFQDFLDRVRSLSRGQVWRYAVVGDLPGVGERLHLGHFGALVRANASAGARGFTFTHKKVLGSADRRAAILRANRGGFTVNLSADSLEDADRLAALDIGPVAVVVPLGHPERSRTPDGRHVIACPAQTKAKLDCSRCELCAVPTRKAIVAFYPHGQLKAEVSRRVALPVIQEAS